jgi:serine/threonine-protein kinase HipA
MVDVSAELVVAIAQYPNFATVGPRMLHAWNAGMNSLRLHKHWSLPSLDALMSDAGFMDVVPPKAPPMPKIGRSPLTLMT